MKPKPINWEVRAVKAEAEAREATEKYIQLKWDRAGRDWAFIALLITACTLMTLTTWGILTVLQMRGPVLEPYAVYIDNSSQREARLERELDRLWSIRRRAWQALEHAHSGPHNSVAFKILNGEE
jgi:hypothetical protein